LNIVRKRSYVVTEDQESLESIIRANYGEIKKIRDVVVFLEQFNLVLSSELYKGDVIQLPNLPKYLTGENPSYVKYPFKKTDNLKQIISNYYENEPIDIDKTEKYIKKISNIKAEPKAKDIILLPVNLPSYFYCNKLKTNSINFMECFNKVIENNEFEEQ